MKKVGIITIYDENNYGNRLQNYAVQEIIKSLGFDVETIKNTNLINGENYLNKALKIDPKRREKFLEFNNENMNNTEDVIFHSEIPENFHERYDYFVIGSDQIWNYNFTDRFSDAVFANFAPYEKRISFSASFGISEVEAENHYKYKYLKDMKAISVRENAGAKIVKDITGREDTVVLLDPTMILEKSNWEKVIKKPSQLNSKKYILEYFLGNISEGRRKEIERFAKQNDCEIINILDKNSFYASGPSEFLYLIKNSFFVLTDSFHSCVFSILFDKPFLVFDRDEDGMRNMNSRIETLLNKFDLQDRKFNGHISNDSIEVNYDAFSSIIFQERDKANNYLRQALEINA